MILAALKLMRPHQWSKNLLVFVSMLVGHQYHDMRLLSLTVLCFCALCLVASAGYVVNDLVDLEDDRNHPQKKHRPLPAGQLSRTTASVVFVLLATAGFLLAALAGPYVLFCLFIYLAISLAYTGWFKRKLLLDIIVLAGLYTLRILAGVAVLGTEPSFWLLGFAMFLFCSLAALKRFIEIQERPAEALEAHSVRAYIPQDQPIISMIGITSGFLAVLVLAFYIDSSEVTSLYEHAVLLWLMCPLLMYWIGRIWLLSSRSLVHGDPVVFALRDRA
ncbi:MAG: UbiA family prenyltransferase, partial [Gammaproteobacteria bacterium]|nr:UbiA family prenyltransferase [Gammaproteobacteria bacterium]